MLRRLYESSADNLPQDSLGFWIQRCGFQILVTGFRIPDSTSKNVPYSEIPTPLPGARQLSAEVSIAIKDD